MKKLNFNARIKNYTSIIISIFSFGHLNAQWELGGPNSLAANHAIQNIHIDDLGNIYAGGIFMNGSSHYVAQYNNFLGWNELGGFNALAANAGISSICSDVFGNVYAAGGFTNVSGSRMVAKFDGSGWSSLGGSSGLNANQSINSICSDTLGNIYAGGGFTNGPSAGSGEQYVAKWNGFTWSELGGGHSLAANGTIHSICIGANGNIYAAGNFKNSSFKQYVAMYDGTSWSEVGGINSLAANNTIYSICIDAMGNIYAAGAFTNSAGKKYVAKYDGSTWTELGGLNSLAANNYILSITKDIAGNIYAGGDFTNNGGYTYIAKFSGTTWRELSIINSSGPFPRIESVCSDAAGNVYAGGFFQNINGKMYVAKYNNYCNVFYTTTYDSTLNNFNLIVDPATASSAIAYQWDFGDGTSSTLSAPSHIYSTDTLFKVCMKTYLASGDSCQYCHTIGIDTAGNVQRSTGFTLSVQNSAGPTGINPTPDSNIISVYPNPFSTQTTIRFNEVQKNSLLKIFDLLGKELRSINFTASEVTINKGDIPSGIYFIQVINENNTITNKKIVIE